MITRRAVFVSAALGSVAGSRTSRAEDVIKFGVINPLSGTNALYGDQLSRGYDIAADEQNAKGGLLGKRIELLRGDATTPQQAIASVQRLHQTGVSGFIGTFSSALANAASDAAAQYGTLYWETSSLAQELTERGLNNFIRSGPNSAAFGEIGAKVVVDLLSPVLKKPVNQIRVYMEHEDSIFGSSVAQRQREVLAAAGVQIVGDSAHSARAIDQTDTVLRAKRANPDVWLAVSYQQSGTLLLRTMRDQGFTPPASVVMGFAEGGDDALQALGAAGLNGLIIVTYPSVYANPKYSFGGLAFLDAYRKKYSSDPLIAHTFSAYVGAAMMFQCIARTGSVSPKLLQDYVAKLDEPVGTYANGFGAKFDKTFTNVFALPTAIQWQDGKLVTIYPTQAAPPDTQIKYLPRG